MSYDKKHVLQCKDVTIQCRCAYADMYLTDRKSDLVFYWLEWLPFLAPASFDAV